MSSLARARSIRWLWLALVACHGKTGPTKKGTVTLHHDAPATARVGERYAYQLQITGTPAGRHWFAGCDQYNPDVKVELDSGKFVFTPKAAGTAHLCASVREDAGVIDEYNFDVAVAPAAGESEAELVTAGAAFAKKLIALDAASTKPKPTACPSELTGQTIDAYESAYLGWLSHHQPGTELGDKGRYYYSPWRSRDARAITRAYDIAAGHPAPLGVEDIAKYRALVSRRYAGVVRATKVVNPQVSLGSYTGGRFDGWLVIGDVESARVVCATPLHYESSAKVGGHGSDDAAAYVSAWESVATDFDLNGTKAARAALASIAPSAKLEAD